jgi:hypothetical protein
MEAWTLVGDAGVAEEEQLDVVVPRQLMNEMVEIPAHSGERFVEGIHVHGHRSARLGPAAADLAGHLP